MTLLSYRGTLARSELSGKGWAGNGLSRVWRGHQIDFKSEVSYHRDRVGGGLSARCQVSVDEERIPRVQRQRLKGAQIHLSPPGNANLGAWQQEAE